VATQTKQKGARGSQRYKRQRETERDEADGHGGAAEGHGEGGAAAGHGDAVDGHGDETAGRGPAAEAGGNGGEEAAGRHGGILVKLRYDGGCYYGKWEDGYVLQVAARKLVKLEVETWVLARCRAKPGAWLDVDAHATSRR
jgi:hypothetical protein